MVTLDNLLMLKPNRPEVGVSLIPFDKSLVHVYSDKLDPWSNYSNHMIQIMKSENTPILVASDSPFSLHHDDLIRHYCWESGLDTITFDERDRVSEDFEINGSKYSVVGMGFIRLKDGKLQLHGRSDYYNKIVDREHAEKLSKITGINFTY